MKTKTILSVTLLLLVAIVFNSCDNSSVANEETGTFSILFDNVVGGNGFTMQSETSTTYNLSTTSGQKFNISTLGYYISKVKLEGPNNTLFEDEMIASASETKGYYHVKQSVPTSTVITLNKIPAGTYNKISFVLGVDEDGVEQGAAAGVLDPAAGAWFGIGMPDM
ncbi:MAG: MbnP family protein [Chitinophagales bacterium]